MREPIINLKEMTVNGKGKPLYFTVYGPNHTSWFGGIIQNTRQIIKCIDYSKDVLRSKTGKITINIKHPYYNIIRVDLK